MFFSCPEYVRYGNLDFTIYHCGQNIEEQVPEDCLWPVVNHGLPGYKATNPIKCDMMFAACCKYNTTNFL